MLCLISAFRGMAMGQEDLFPLWDGSVELAKTLMMPPGRFLGGSATQKAEIHGFKRSNFMFCQCQSNTMDYSISIGV